MSHSEQKEKNSRLREENKPKARRDQEWEKVKKKKKLPNTRTRGDLTTHLMQILSSQHMPFFFFSQPWHLTFHFCFKYSGVGFAHSIPPLALPLLKTSSIFLSPEGTGICDLWNPVPSLDYREGVTRPRSLAQSLLVLLQLKSQIFWCLNNIGATHASGKDLWVLIQLERRECESCLEVAFTQLIQGFLSHVSLGAGEESLPCTPHCSC